MVKGAGDWRGIGVGLGALVMSAGVAVGEGGLVLLPKQIVAPAEDILTGVVRLPDLASLGVVSRHAVLPVEWAVGKGGVDGVMEWDGAFLVGDASSVRMALVAPAGAEVAWDGGRVGGVRAIGDSVRRSVEGGVAWSLVGEPRVEVVSFEGGGSLTGRWEVWARGEGVGRGVGEFEAYFVVAMDSAHALRSHVTTHRLVVGEPIGVVSRIETDAKIGGAATVAEAMFSYETAGGSRSVEMFDDGLHGDGGVGDGVFGGSVVVEAPGAVAGRVTARGVTDEGLEFVRTTEHSFEVVAGDVGLGDGAVLMVEDGGVEGGVRLDVPLRVDGAGRRFFLAGEVWGVDPLSGDAKPACWAGMMSEARVGLDGGSIGSLYVDGRWLALSEVVGPYEVRNVRVQCGRTFVVLDEVARVGVAVGDGVELPAVRGRAVDAAMLNGRPRAELGLVPTLSGEEMAGALSVSRAFGAHNLMLVHGYCAGGNPWPPGDFSGFTEAFSDPDQNRSHDEFAQLILAFGNNSKSYGIVGHSQGGTASLHLWNFYFSGLDWATGGRRIQSVGTPYQGTPLASLGGFSCGVNNDMTPGGSAAWLANIPTASRAEVYYWTTQHSGSWCDFFANLVLSTPNDGVIEVAGGQLPSGNNMGNLSGWCHTTGMSDPAHYTDSVRNAEMDANAAR